jgi:hypothetical protein
MDSKIGREAGVPAEQAKGARELTEEQFVGRLNILMPILFKGLKGLEKISGEQIQKAKGEIMEMRKARIDQMSLAMAGSVKMMIKAKAIQTERDPATLDLSVAEDRALAELALNIQLDKFPYVLDLENAAGVEKFKFDMAEDLLEKAQELIDYDFSLEERMIEIAVSQYIAKCRENGVESKLDEIEKIGPRIKEANRKNNFAKLTKIKEDLRRLFAIDLDSEDDLQKYIKKE